MQQEPAPQNQMGSQAAAVPQQMMLYPVRVVYETQMLVQAGEQMQPNQTIYINPQNTPPWIQNRPVQPQVVYLQQMPCNIGPPVQQIVDPNQMYHQNYQPQVFQPIPQIQDIRPYQVQNMTYSAQNLQNTSANISNQPNSQIYHTNYAQYYPNIVQNPPTPVSIQTNNVNMKQTFSNIQELQTNQNILNTQKDLVPQTVMDKTNLKANIQQPQTMTVTPIQQTYPTTQSYRPPQPRNNFINTQQLMKATAKPGIVTKFRGSPPMKASPIIKDQTFAYKQIQPKPQIIVENTPNNIQKFSHMPNIVQIPHNVNNKNITKLNQVIQYTLNNMNKEIKPSNTETNMLNKRVKSESPDVINKNSTNMIVAEPNIIEMKRKSNDLIIKNNLVQENKTLISNTILREHQEKLEELKIKINNSLDNQKSADNYTEPKLEDPITNCKDNLVRHTVFTQARNRNVNDDHTKTILKDTKNIVEETKIDLKTDTKVEKGNNVDVMKDKMDNKGKTDFYDQLYKSFKDMRGNDKVLTNNASKTEKDYILTHVLDGNIIQESNSAFPIQELKKVQIGPKVLDIGKEEVRIGCKKNVESSKEEKIKVTKNDPFAELKSDTVKSWTVNQLCTYLGKYEWDDTISVLREQEIDGESLFLVNKTQLLIIGVQEEHADIICDFVNS